MRFLSNVSPPMSTQHFVSPLTLQHHRNHHHITRLIPNHLLIFTPQQLMFPQYCHLTKGNHHNQQPRAQRDTAGATTATTSSTSPHWAPYTNRQYFQTPSTRLLRHRIRTCLQLAHKHNAPIKPHIIPKPDLRGLVVPFPLQREECHHCLPERDINQTWRSWHYKR